MIPPLLRTLSLTILLPILVLLIMMGFRSAMSPAWHESIFFGIFSVLAFILSIILLDYVITETRRNRQMPNLERPLNYLLSMMVQLVFGALSLAIALRLLDSVPVFTWFFANIGIILLIRVAHGILAGWNVLKAR
jgi:hypothetical protein